MSDICGHLVSTAKLEGIEKFVVGSAIMKGNEILIVFRADSDDFLPGYAEIPGGGAEEDESLVDALHRETMEETGLQITEIIGYAGEFDYLSGSGKKTRQFNFLVTPANYNIELNPVEHVRYIWLPLDNEWQIDELHMTPEMRHSIEEIRSLGR